MRTAVGDIEQALADETGLVRRSQAGDRHAFAVLVERYWNPLYRWLYHLCHHRHTAEDLAQEALLKAFASIASFEAGTNFRAWLFRIAYNRFLNMQQLKVGKRQPFPMELLAPSKEPIEQVLSREAMQLLALTLGRLPREFRAPFILRAEESLPFREIAKILQITEETARWRVFKARQRLMQALAPYMGRTEKS
jgi:RNA polymerase sigma-70 factor (ECF subfamily)